MKKNHYVTVMLLAAASVFSVSCAPVEVASTGDGPDLRKIVYMPKPMKPIDSVQKLKVGDKAPDFTLPVVDGGKVRLSQYRGRKNVVLSFIPSTFIPVSSREWPGYNLAMNEVFKANHAELLGITVDNAPAVHAWIGLFGGFDFKVLSDFWPHGKVASKYGVLRSDGMPELATVVIDKKGVIRYFGVHNINKRPSLDELVNALKKVNKR